MKSFKLSSALVFLFFIVLTLYAGPCEYIGKCKEIEQKNLNAYSDCLAKELEKHDILLNKIYKEIYFGEHKDRLKIAEIFWVKFKESDCIYIARKAQKGSDYKAIFTSCLINKTKARIEDLNRSLFSSDWFNKHKDDSCDN